MHWKLMSDDAITPEQREIMAQFILNSPKLTYGERVKQFENEWSEWQGCRYSVFVNSGSSANLMMVDAVNQLFGNGGYVAQSCTWATNVAPLLQLKGVDFVELVDADLKNLGADLSDLETIFRERRPKYFFMTHVLGFPAVSDEFFNLCARYDVKLLEDCCESHGASFNGKKIGNFGLVSSFSFYYGHHLTTIEGGMVCTDDKNLYERLLLLRSHGLLRELPPEEREKNIVPDCDPRFTFLCTGYNFRNVESHAVLGTEQLKSLDEHIEIRNRNLQRFAENLDNAKYYNDFRLEGVSSYAFPIIGRNLSAKQISEALTENGIENRPLIAGNLYRHPMMQGFRNGRQTPHSDLIHEQGIYVGNHQHVTTEMVDGLCEILNSID